MAVAQLRPNERYALVGKTRSGKTALAMVLAGTFARALPDPWEVWWLDTKNDPKDISALRKWGFRNVMSDSDRKTMGALLNAVYYKIDTNDKDRHDVDTVEQVQAICAEAYARTHTIVVIDEYVQATPSSRIAGKALLDVFQRGGGNNVGLIGLTQEPVFVPRQLISQATHVVLLSLTYKYDVQYARNLCPEYVSPNRMGNQYGFYWSWVDGNAEWTYYEDQLQWYDKLQVVLPRPPTPQELPTQTGA